MHDKNFIRNKTNILQCYVIESALCVCSIFVAGKQFMSNLVPNCAVYYLIKIYNKYINKYINLPMIVSFHIVKAVL